MSDQKLMQFAVKRSPWRHFVVWFVFYASCIVSTDDNFFASVLLSGGLAVALVYAAALSTLAKRPWQYATIAAYWVVAALTLLLALVYGLHFRRMGPVDADAIRAIAQTDLFEAVHYLGVHVSLEAIGAAAVVTILLLLTFPFSATRVQLGVTSQRTLLLPAVAASTMIIAGAVPVFKPIYQYISNYKEQLTVFRSSTRHMNGLKPATSAVKTAHRAAPSLPSGRRCQTPR